MTFTITDLSYIQPAKLKAWITKVNSSPQFLVVDVRDSDFIGGHIKGCLHIPSADIGYESTNILTRMFKHDITTVIFHCALSQQRGPSSAMKFLRYLNEVLEDATADPKEKAFVNKINVSVLRGGFVKWQELYGKDTSVTEGYEQSLWE
ncbi:hypothetical protein FOA43_002551 [Brettanomyces nanus]|uniref:Rhodanese domain-containing protein n=1 Tax=Eeniella nana TaxID=13502 RepID=A0A875S095_EENNA|nr:uncharacterized protein FOA43_002551 [Brettanomyces nanus]QPG75201.1 hypothetical protein FOA43_002551 [Brettanomyces nanus]